MSDSLPTAGNPSPSGGRTTPTCFSLHLRKGVNLMLAASLGFAGAGGAAGRSLDDPFDTQATVPQTAAKNLLRSTGMANVCDLEAPKGIVDIALAVEHALCSNPKTQQAWADVKLRAAQVGTASSAYLPTLSATLRSSVDHTASDVPSQPALSSSQGTSFRDYTLSLSWTLLDFGTRAAESEIARQTLIAAQAAQDDTLQSIFSTTVKDYYAAIAARSALDAAVSTEDDARRTLQAATVRLRGGVAGVIDQLQAQTEYAQAVFIRAKAAGEARVTQGVLAVDMGLPPNIPFALPAMPDEVHPEIGLDRSINELLDEARRYHPKTIEARAQLQAALAKVDDVRAQGRPTLSLNARLSNNNQPVVPSVGLAALPATGRDRFVGLQVNVPIFEGYARSYAVRAASATAEQQEASLHDAEQQVTLNVWTTYVTLETSSDNLRNTEVLVDSARKSYAAAQQRYEKGVGAIIELLSAQTALSNARQRRVQSVLDWRTARLQLAASLGTLSLLALQ